MKIFSSKEENYLVAVSSAHQESISVQRLGLSHNLGFDEPRPVGGKRVWVRVRVGGARSGRHSSAVEAPKNGVPVDVVDDDGGADVAVALDAAASAEAKLVDWLRELVALQT